MNLFCIRDECFEGITAVPPPSTDSSYVNVSYHLLSDSKWKTCSELTASIMALNPIIKHTPPAQLKEL